MISWHFFGISLWRQVIRFYHLLKSKDKFIVIHTFYFPYIVFLFIKRYTDVESPPSQSVSAFSDQAAPPSSKIIDDDVSLQLNTKYLQSYEMKSNFPYTLLATEYLDIIAERHGVPRNDTRGELWRRGRACGKFTIAANINHQSHPTHFIFHQVIFRLPSLSESEKMIDGVKKVSTIFAVSYMR